MNRLEMRTEFYAKMGEASTNPFFDTTTVNSFLGEAWEKIWKLRGIPWNWLISETKLGHLVKTYVAGSSSGTTLVVASVSGMFNGQWLHVHNGSSYERVSIKSIAGKTITLESNTPLRLSYSASSSNLVYSNHLRLPNDIHRIIGVDWEHVESSGTEKKNLKVSDEDFGLIRNGSEPSKYYRRAFNIFIYPLPDESDYYFRLLYLYNPGDLLDNTDPPLPDEYHHLIVDYAIWRAMVADRRANQELANMYYQEFMRGLEEMAAENAYYPDSKPTMRW